ncbi:hypothetical protein ABW18_08550 [Gordonia jacobaea]|uniref:Secreted protein n=1 Tax=Gordonia jacobaea TaxID=122202 RepID=A0ABR5IEL4_9ACTN|nr:hypothetical protein ABW18_08550 [Gordonia jacobaea]
MGSVLCWFARRASSSFAKTCSTRAPPSASVTKTAQTPEPDFPVVSGSGAARRAGCSKTVDHATPDDGEPRNLPTMSRRPSPASRANRSKSSGSMPNGLLPAIVYLPASTRRTPDCPPV